MSRIALNELSRSFRYVAASLVLAASLVVAAETRVASAGETAVTVFKSPSCGCCAKWVDHLRGHGFKVQVHDRDDLDMVKRMLGIPEDLQSCHTATVDGYVVEGHVPAKAMQRLLSERPEVKGLAVPGMPAGSPGMEGPRAESYLIYGFEGNGERSVFESVPAR